MPYLSFAIVCLLFGTNFVLMSRAGLAMGPVTIGAARLGGAALVLLIAWGLLSPAARVPRGKLPACLLVGLMANGYPYCAVAYLVAQGFGHSFFGVMVAFTPLLTVIASAPLLGVWPTTRQLVGVLGGLVFMGLLLVDGWERGMSLALLSVAFSVPLAYATANTLMRRILSDVPPTALTATLMGIPALVLTPLALATPLLAPLGLAGPESPAHWPTALAATVWLGVLGTGLTMWLFVQMVQQQGPLFAGMVTYVVPVVAMLWGVADGETITWLQLAAIIGILLSVTLVQYGAVRSSRVAPQPHDLETPLREAS